jgi:hypothetical protein
MPIERVKFCLDIKNNGAFPLDPVDHECLSLLSSVVLSYSCNSIVIQFTTNEQLKYLTHIICFRIPCFKLYKEGLFSYVFTIKYM